MSKPIRIYWDSCVWLAIILEERAVSKGEGQPDENRFAMCQSIIEGAERGIYEIIVSAFTLAEVCKSRKAKSENSPKLQLFLDHEYIIVIPVDKDIGLKAQTLQTSGLFGLKPADAVHIASAQRANVGELHSFDTDMLKLDRKIAGVNGQAIKICKPGEAEPLGGLFNEDQSN